MYKILILCVAILLSSITSLRAEQLLGINITYRNIGSNKYVVTYKVYTDKSDAAVFKPLVFKIISGAVSVTNYPTLITIDSIDVGCITNKKINPIYIYQEIIDLDQAIYSGIKSSGNCRTYFTCTYPERYRGQKNIPASAYFTFAFINTCNNSSNSLAQTHNLPYQNTCCNQPSFRNFNVSDTINFDSMSYKLSLPYSNMNSTINYSSGYSLNEQVDVYWPVGYDKLNGPNPNVNPPIGFNFDQSRGDLVFTPTICNSDYNIVTEVTEHKKIGNQYKEVGGFLNDFVINVSSCPDNNAPVLYGPYKREVTAGQLICFTITSDDKQFIPPPPQKPSPPDTVRITWNRGIPGATFTVLNPKARLQQGKFCWTSKVTQASDIPYTFTVTARDNACPFSAFSIRTYSVKLTKPVSVPKSNTHKITLSPNPSPNGELNITSDNFKFNEVLLYTISGQQLASWNFNHTYTFSKDLSFLATGVYFIKFSNGDEVYNYKWIRE